MTPRASTSTHPKRSTPSRARRCPSRTPRSFSRPRSPVCAAASSSRCAGATSTSRSARSGSRARSRTARSRRPRAVARPWSPRRRRSSRASGSAATPPIATIRCSRVTSPVTSTHRRYGGGSSSPATQRACARSARSAAYVRLAGDQPREHRAGPGVDGPRPRCVTCTTYQENEAELLADAFRPAHAPAGTSLGPTSAPPRSGAVLLLCIKRYREPRVLMLRPAGRRIGGGLKTRPPRRPDRSRPGGCPDSTLGSDPIDDTRGEVSHA
jgi:hypothetical protein